MKVKITENDVMEISHKLNILRDEPDLQADYGLTQEQADDLVKSIPRDGGEWVVPDWAIEAVKGEMEDHAVVLRAIARSGCGGDIGQELSIHRQAKRFEEKFQ